MTTSNVTVFCADLTKVRHERQEREGEGEEGRGGEGRGREGRREGREGVRGEERVRKMEEEDNGWEE